MAELTTIDAFDLCSRVLDRSQGDVAPLLKLTGGQETDWLEFKASCERPVEGLSPGETADDYRWHVARAMVALANTHGGCLLLGVNDDGEPVGLGPSDPSGQIANDDMDGFLRHLDDAVFRRGAGWKCGKGRVVKFDESLPENLIEYRQASLGGIPVVAVLVRPVATEASCLYCSETVDDKQRHFLLIRQAGQLGQVREIARPKEIVKWEKERKPANRHLAELWKRFEQPGPRRSNRRPWLLVGTTSLLLLLLGLVTYHFVKPNLFATIQVRKLEMEFAGNRANLNSTVLESMASMLRQTVPASGTRLFAWNEWKQIAKGVMERVLDVKGAKLTAKAEGSEHPAGTEKDESTWLDAIVLGGPPPPKATKFVPTRLSLTSRGLEILIKGDFESIKGMSEKALEDEIRGKLVVQGIPVP